MVIIASRQNQWWARGGKRRYGCRVLRASYLEGLDDVEVADALDLGVRLQLVVLLGNADAVLEEALVDLLAVALRHQHLGRGLVVTVLPAS